jgi:phosphatidylserine/phosphatidylglycerophosphate/cardiolipin synthase-like enzyme
MENINHTESDTEPTSDRRYWKRSHAEKGAFMTSGAAYYRAFREALRQAESYVCMLAWDLTGDIELVRGESPDDDLPTRLADFLYALLDQKPDLEIYILLWDYSVVYLAEREWVPFSRFRRNPHPRLHLVTDSAINAGASHHQKVVVVDGQFAFNGGLDFSKWRWDTDEHKPGDPRRVTPDGEHYQPYHDIQAALTGPAARTLDELCRDRWKRATNKSAPWPEPSESVEIWPPSLKVEFEKETAAFALTYSAYKDYPAITQVEALYLARIAAAERYIYLENQYLSSHPIADAIAKRLEEPDGPEAVLIITRDTGGWLEEGTLGLLRSRLLEKLRSADKHKRFAAYYPHVRDKAGNESQVYVHAKAMICDDATLLHGSANLSNRSMKVDSEIVMALGLGEPAPVAETMLHRLLGIHLDQSADAIQEALAATGSIHETIRRLRANSRHQLRDLHYDPLNSVQRKLADTQLLDPDDPIDLGYWLRKNFK